MSIEMLIILPALFTLMFLGVQAALFYQARTAAIAAAQEGARIVAGENGTETAGIRAAETYIAATGGDNVLPGAFATADRTPTTASVTIQGHSLSVIPGWTLTVRQSATAPVERLTTNAP